MAELGHPFTAAAAPVRSWRPVWAALLGLAAFDFLAPDLLVELETQGRVAWEMIVLGALAGQVLLLAVWAVLGPARFWQRWLSALAALGGLYATFLAGMAIADIGPDVWRMYAINGLLLPVVFLGAQLPLWLLRVAAGRGLRWEDNPSDASGGAQFGLRDAVTAFALIGVSLGLARLAVLLHDMQGAADEAPDSWLNLALACGAFVLWSALGATPCAMAAFFAARPAAATLAVAIYAAAAVTAASALVAVVADQRRFFLDLLEMLLAFHIGLVAMVLGSCHALRAWGCTLRKG